MELLAWELRQPNAVTWELQSFGPIIYVITGSALCATQTPSVRFHLISHEPYKDIYGTGNM